jgi:hypothetical protein
MFLHTYFLFLKGRFKKMKAVVYVIAYILIVFDEEKASPRQDGRTGSPLHLWFSLVSSISRILA